MKTAVSGSQRCCAPAGSPHAIVTLQEFALQLQLSGFFVQTIVAGELQANVWAATPSPTVPVFWSALQQVVGRARELAQQALSAEAEASARATLRIKELQDQVTQSTREIDRLGQELEEKGELCDREQAHAEVRCHPYCVCR
jgi:hypothetical protein